MELITVTPSSLKSTVRGIDIPVIRIYPKGTISFNKHAIKTFSLKKGDKVLFHQDKSKPKDWYISFGIHGFKLGSFNQGDMRFNNMALKSRLMESVLGTDKGKIIIPIVTLPQLHGEYTLYSLLTSNYT